MFIGVNYFHFLEHLIALKHNHYRHCLKKTLLLKRQFCFTVILFCLKFLRHDIVYLVKISHVHLRTIIRYK